MYDEIILENLAEYIGLFSSGEFINYLEESLPIMMKPSLQP